MAYVVYRKPGSEINEFQRYKYSRTLKEMVDKKNYILIEKGLNLREAKKLCSSDIELVLKE